MIVCVCPTSTQPQIFRNGYHTPKAVGESRVPVSRPKASSPGRKKLMLDTRKYKNLCIIYVKTRASHDLGLSRRNYLANHRAPYLACGDRDISGYIIA